MQDVHVLHAVQCAVKEPGHVPSPSAADSADSSSRLLEGSAADPAARAPSKETAVEIWLRAARCHGSNHSKTGGSLQVDRAGAAIAVWK